MGKDGNGNSVNFFRPKLTSRHVILHVSAYLCDTCPHSPVSTNMATIYIWATEPPPSPSF